MLVVSDVTEKSEHHSLAEHSNTDDGKIRGWQNPATKDKISQQINGAVRRVVYLCLLENYHEGNSMSDMMSPPPVPQRLRDELMLFSWVTCAAATVSYDAQLIGNMSNWAQRVNNTSPRGGPSLSWCAAGSTFQELACHIYLESDMSCYISAQQYLSFALFCCFMLFLLSCS